MKVVLVYTVHDQHTKHTHQKWRRIMKIPCQQIFPFILCDEIQHSISGWMRGMHSLKNGFWIWIFAIDIAYGRNVIHWQNKQFHIINESHVKYRTRALLFCAKWSKSGIVVVSVVFFFSSGSYAMWTF